LLGGSAGIIERAANNNGISNLKVVGSFLFE